MSENEKIILKGLDLKELENWVTEIGEKPFRAKQVFHWMYKQGAMSISEMTNLSKKFLKKSDSKTVISLLKIKLVAASKIDDTRKYLFQLKDGELIESVYMNDGKRVTLCLSTMVGCNIGCPYCATGLMGYKRKLTTGEIIDQFFVINNSEDNPITNVVFMGMGEPFLNYENSIKAAKILNNEAGPALSNRHITISTCGIIPAIKKIADQGYRFNLAISLNGSNNRQRDELVPINTKYPINDLLEAAKYYYKKIHRKITFEYILIKDFNDTPEDAKRLIKMLSSLPCKLNIIPFNENSHVKYKCPDENTINKFMNLIIKAPFVVTIRRSKGQDISAACGQLYAEHS